MSKQRFFSLINISGLTIGIACSLLIILYIIDEWQYDKFHQDVNRIYRVAFEGKLQGRRIASAKTAFPLAPEIARATPQVESVLRMVNWATFPVRYEDKSFTEDYLLLADRNFFRFFSFNLVVGHPDTVLTGKRKVVISESAARRYFNYKGTGDHTPLGKTLELAQGYTAQVSGIAEDAPLNSHFHYSLILSLDSWEDAPRNDWESSLVLTYIKTRDEKSTGKLQTAINQVAEKGLNDQLMETRQQTLDAFKKQGNDFNYFLQPLRDIHLQSHLSDEPEINGNIEYLYLFSGVAAFIVFLACINFMNLTTAQSASRAKEVAVRKAVGAQNNRLIFQFLLESYFYVVVAVLLALTIILLALEPFNYFTGKGLRFSTLSDWEFLSGIFFFVAITGLVAGSYPAFYLTHYSPIEVLKGNLRAKLRSYGIRNVLVVFQFFISVALIIATLVVYHQLQYIQSANLGFDKHNIINLLHTRNLGHNGKAFKAELLKHEVIVAASYCNRLPPNVDWQSGFRREGDDKEFLLAIYEMDGDHPKTLGYRMAAGDFFSGHQRQDSFSILLNRTAALKLGVGDFKGKKLLSGYDQPHGRVREVIGIMEDFNFQSLKDPIQPLAIVPGPEPNWEMAIRIKDGKVDESVAIIRKLWKKYAPTAPLEFTTVEKNFHTKMDTERRIGVLFMGFTMLAIVIACLGLFGLATFMAEQQRKEIGIRKVMGATVSHIISMLNRDFLTLVLIANVLAWPITWWIMNQWLQQFAYHIRIPWWIFLLAGSITVLISFFSVSFQAFKAASGNPVNSLRNE